MKNKVYLNKFRVQEAALRCNLKLQDIAEMLGVPYQTVAYRFKHGWRPVEAQAVAVFLKTSLGSLTTVLNKK